MHQSDVARQIRVITETTRNWELGHTEPAIRHFPAIVRFLGYIPMPRPTTLAEELCTFRKLKGMSRKEFARRIGVDPSTVGRWESGERLPNPRLHQRIESLIRPMLKSSRWG